MNTQPMHLSPEMLVSRLGDSLVQKGHISEADLQKALAYQQEQLAQGKTCLLGQALLDLNLLKQSALDQVVTEQIIQLRNALQAANRSLEERVQQRTAELQGALERLSELSQMKANFVSNISHELRTPLTHIKGYVELMVSESLGPVTAEQKHALQVSQQSTVRLEGLIDDLIMFSLTSRGELSLRLESVDIARLANLSIKSVEQKAKDRGITVHAVLDKDLPLVQADPQKIAWALGQLLDNAIKFTSSGGRVVLGVQRETANLVITSVTDTGIGIPPHHIEEIFEPFHQLDGSSTRKYGGTGIGLSLVRQIVEAHGSMLEVVSMSGKGSTFKFPLLTIAE
ncbi:MAG TPA: ATP-binding protein [Anaerolineales bacterium]|nr:ATP-binding protein [Anaerolineales bacterium]